MKSMPYIPSMVQAITVLTVLKMMTKAAQTPCDSGSMNGRIMYERLPNIQLQGFDDNIVRDTAPPFMVLEKCENLCLMDRDQNNIVKPCASFDFQPGGRLANYNGGPDYEESTCYLTPMQAKPEGIGNLMMVPNSVHFTEVCITSNRPERECPNRKYVFERHPRKKLKLPDADMKQMTADNRSECEDKCLNEFSFVCRSATFDATMRTCTLSRFTRRTHPELLQDDPDSDYLENTCLSAERRCDGLAVFIKEQNKRLSGPFEVDMLSNITLEDCQGMCVRAEKYLCRSIEYDEMTKVCTLSEEDSISQKDDIDMTSNAGHHFYDFACLDSPRGSEYPDNSATSHLFTGKRPDTAFQRYRNSRLGGEHHSEISGRSLSECLDECLRQPSFQCKSAEYSERYRTCRLTRYNQRDGMRIIYDADYDYYENLMLGGEGEGGQQQQRPGDGPDRYRPGGGSDRYPGRYPPPRPYPGDHDRDRYPPPRYPPSGGSDNWISGGGRPPPGRYPYPADNEIYPDDYDRYPPPRYPPRPDRDRYPIGPSADRYPPPSAGGSRYPPDQYLPPTGMDRYPGPMIYRPGDRYADRLPPIPADRYDDRDRDRLPPGAYRPGDRYAGSWRYGADRYPPPDDRYGNRRYPDRYRPEPDRYADRYPPPPPPPDRYGRPGPAPGRPDRFDYYDDRRGGGVAGGGRYPYRRRPYDDRPVRPISPGPDGPIYDDYSGQPQIPGRPFQIPCEDGESFNKIGSRQRMRKEFVRRFMSVPSLRDCERECSEARDFICRSFNYKNDVGGGPYDAENCELSDRDTRDMEMNNAQFFDATGTYDFYERSAGRQGVDGECLDVSQVCNEDGMELTLRTMEPFFGRIYAYGFYDRCFFRGNGGNINVLRISGAQGYPECGTQRYGDTMTNIVVVQFSDNVMTSRDKRYNLTCLFRGPGEAVVSSGFIGAGAGSPIPIEYLPAENTLSSKVRLMILYQGRPTTTIAVGDPLTFRIEAQDGYNYATDLFATNVVARDPYSGRSVQLIDRYGCPVDSFVFPELGKGRDGDSLEARFNAFKIPESNFLVFEATVRTCRDSCQPAYCPAGSGRAETSYGRRKREVNGTLAIEGTNSTTALDLDEEEFDGNETVIVVSASSSTTVATTKEEETSEEPEVPEYVREMIEVFESREELQHEARRAIPAPETVCLSKGEYHGLISAVLSLVAILLTVALASGLAYRRYWTVMRKTLSVERPISTSTAYPTSTSSVSAFSVFSGGPNSGSTSRKPFGSLSRMRNFPSLARVDDVECPIGGPGGPFEDPSEPIYTDPSMFERSRSLRSIAVSQKSPQKKEFRI